MKLMLLWALWTGSPAQPTVFYAEQADCEQVKLVMGGRCLPGYYNATLVAPKQPRAAART